MSKKASAANSLHKMSSFGMLKNRSTSQSTQSIQVLSPPSHLGCRLSGRYQQQISKIKQLAREESRMGVSNTVDLNSYESLATLKPCPSSLDHRGYSIPRERSFMENIKLQQSKAVAENAHHKIGQPHAEPTHKIKNSSNFGQSVSRDKVSMFKELCIIEANKAEEKR